MQTVLVRSSDASPRLAKILAVEYPRYGYRMLTLKPRQDDQTDLDDQIDFDD